MPAGDLITGRWQVEWRDKLLGWPETNLLITEVRGWRDKPPGRSTPQDRPGRHGQAPSNFRLSGRTVEVDVADMREVDDLTDWEALADLIATGEDDGLEPLVVYLDGQAQLVFGRCERALLPTDQPYSVGYRRATLVWACPDPRRYSLALHSETLRLVDPGGGGGLVFPIVFPMAFGDIAAPQQVTVVNAGSVPTWPIFEITGPVPGAGVENLTSGQALRFDPDFTIPAGVTLTIDTGLKDVSMYGVSYRGALVVADWFSLPGKTPNAAAALQPRDIRFTGAAFDPAASLTVKWRDACN